MLANNLRKMKTTIIFKQEHVGNDNQSYAGTDNQHMTSLEIAEVTGKQHKNVMQAIRNMEPAWEKVCGLKFQLTSRTIIQPNGGTREVPCDSLTSPLAVVLLHRFEMERKIIFFFALSSLIRTFK